MKILCFVDSITWGYLPNGQRTPHPWPNVLQSFRKKDIIINQGMPGRTAYKAEADLCWCLKQYHPDLICIMLGSNDLSENCGRTVRDVIHDLRILSKTAQQEGNVLLMVPPQISEDADPQWNYRPGISIQMKDLAKETAELCQKESFSFFNTQITVQPSVPDGLHLNEKNQFLLGCSVNHYLNLQKQ